MVVRSREEWLAYAWSIFEEGADQHAIAADLHAQAAALRASGDDPTLLATFLMCVASFKLVWQHDEREVLSLVSEALTLVDPDKDSRLFLDTINLKGLSYRESGELARACEVFTAMHRRALASDDRKYEFKSLSNLVHVFIDLGDYAAASELARETMALVTERATHPLQRCEVGVACLTAMVQSGRWEAAEDELPLVEALFAQVHRRSGYLIGMLNENRAALALHRGDLGLAREIGVAWLASASARFSDPRARMYGVLADAAILEGNGSEALEHVTAGLEVLRSRVGVTGSRLLRRRAHALRVLGRHDAAWQALEHSCDAAIYGRSTSLGNALRRLVDRYLDEVNHQREIEIQTVNDALRTANRDLEAARSRAEKAAALRRQFLSSMSHEIRTPLHGIIGPLDVLKEQDLDPLSVELVEIVQTSANLTLEVVNSILEFGRIESGRLDLDPVDVSLSHLVAEVFEIVSDAAARHNNALVSSVDPDVPDVVRLDDRRAKQVVLNLVANAVKFTQDGTVQVHVSTTNEPSLGQAANVAPAVTSGASSERWLLVRVIDDGVGIAPEALEELFEPFVQASMRTAREHGGSGLGLAIAQGIVQTMGGELGVVSEPGVGSVFSFTTPLVELDA